MCIYEIKCSLLMRSRICGGVGDDGDEYAGCRRREEGREGLLGWDGRAWLELDITTHYITCTTTRV